WNIPLRYELRGGALQEWNNFNLYLESIPNDHITTGPSSLVWPLQRDGRFSVKSCRQAFSDKKFLGVATFPHDVIWVHVVPTKIQCFLWKVWHKRIATIDNLQKRGFQMVNLCVLCTNQLESTYHIFLRCVFTSAIWNRISSILSLHGPHQDDVSSLISSWKGMNCVPRFRMVKKVILHAFFWYIWMERNDRIFKEESGNPSSI
ncbi:Putative ribonuclease H protein At1g65750, partial [Linum perenne]